MDSSVQKIVGLLDDESNERRHAAAIVLGALKIRDKTAVRALERCLAESDPLLQRYALAAAKASGVTAAAALARELDGGPVPRRRAIIEILARDHRKVAAARRRPRRCGLSAGHQAQARLQPATGRPVFCRIQLRRSRDEDEKDFGGALLGHVATKSPRSKLGRSAKNKLRLAGLE